MSASPANGFRVYVLGAWPKPKKQFVPELFPTRRKARTYCRNRRSRYPYIYIVHPDGTEEQYRRNPPGMPQETAQESPGRSAGEGPLVP